MIKYYLIVIVILSLLGCHPKNVSKTYFDLKTYDTTVVAAPGSEYKKWIGHRILFGSHYRRLWAKPVPIPVLDVSREKGGLEAFEQGGSRQTYTLKLRDKSGQEYALRSINKNPARALKPGMAKSPLGAIMKDQTSADHPFGALTLPILADAVGVFHTNPKAFYIPDDPKLGEFRQDFAGLLAILEERPDGDATKISSFGNAKEVISTKKFIEKLEKDNDNRIDTIAFLRARMLDMLIGDWGRHPDQWRWAEFKENGKTLYTPIPRDRDHAYFKFRDGLIPWIASRKWAMKNYQTFGKKFHNVDGLTNSARELDQLFLTGISYEKWQAEAELFKSKITDEIIHKAVSAMPVIAYSLTGKKMERNLRSRRNLLHKAARKHYKVLAENLVIMGSDKHELFKVQPAGKDSVEVSMYKINAEGLVREKLYSSKFSLRDTKSINLYGREGKDVYEIANNLPKKLQIKKNAALGKKIDTLLAGGH